MKRSLGPRELPTTKPKSACATGIHTWTEPKPATTADTQKCVVGITFTMRRECRTCGQVDLWLTAKTPRETFQPNRRQGAN